VPHQDSPIEIAVHPLAVVAVEINMERKYKNTYSNLLLVVSSVQSIYRKGRVL
jgi:hypothetical protein